ncbi:MAG: hypothetical protein GWN01_06190, partial [Nitrosopumilaceae archaeon]|nr:hypothetical protein [Nitrosopumilaceae archaeon]NIU86914.1 hypothetical protein [Nitrosopumilaceae archaeon]NIV65591.1 hypothetical protein [Nitrosopumilaceae archaeon]NIX61130.1 hypothetical protein [Nitrosopumilaceae archaeon]
TNDTEKIRELAEELFFSGRYEMTYYKILKNTYPPDEWGKIRDRIIEKIRGGKKLIETYKVEAICNIHVEENQKEKLLKLLKLNETHLHLIDRFAFHLKNDYPEEILQLYRTAVNKFVERTGRSIYNQAVEYLKKMEKVKGGKAIVNKMVKNFKIVYNNRPAMMEILRENFSL